MIDAAEDRTDALFHALADRTRRDILRRVLVQEQSASSLAPQYDMSLTAVQKHVQVLERAGLVTKRRRGREALARGDVSAVRSALQLLRELEQQWRDRIGRIDALLEAEPATDTTPPAAPLPKEQPCPSPPSTTTSTPSP